MREEKTTMLIGGPLEGGWVKVKGDRVRFPVKVTPSVGPIVDYPDHVPINHLEYRRHTVTHHRTGKSVEVFAPSDWTIDQVCARLDELSPDGT